MRFMQSFMRKQNVATDVGAKHYLTDKLVQNTHDEIDLCQRVMCSYDVWGCIYV